MVRPNPVTPPSNGLQAAPHEDGPPRGGAIRPVRPAPLIPQLNDLNPNQRGPRVAPPDLALLNGFLRRVLPDPVNLWPALEAVAGNHVIPNDQHMGPRADRMAVLAHAARVVNGRHLISPGSTPQRPQNNNQQAEGNPRHQNPQGSPRSPEAARAPQYAGTPESARAVSAPQPPNAP